MVFGINNIKETYRRILNRLYKNEFGDYYVMNINRNFLDNSQKRVLLCYIINEFKVSMSSDQIRHVNLSHCLQMIHVLISKGYSIDVFHAKSKGSIKLITGNYEFIIGFGPLYEEVIHKGIKGKRILFLTENDPANVAVKYNERIEYFKERHPYVLLKNNRPRNSFYAEIQVLDSQACIAMNSSFNTKNIAAKMPCYHINVNGLSNPCFSFKEGKCASRRKNFVWFGSNGCIHKGLDILVDVFRHLPNYSLSVYGLPQSEATLINSYRPDNVHLCGSINVLSENYIKEVVEKHAFVISASCSEGMNSGVATCMMHGLIPVLTKENGYEPEEFILELEDYHVENIVKKLKSFEKISDEKLNQLSSQVYNYAQSHFSLDYFTKQFTEIITDLEKTEL